MLDENQRGDGSIGSVLGVFPSAAKAQRFAANLKYAARLTSQGCRIDLAFHPSVNTSLLREIISESPNVRPRLVQLTEDLPPGTYVHPKLHLDFKPSGALRCL